MKKEKSTCFPISGSLTSVPFRKWSPPPARLLLEVFRRIPPGVLAAFPGEIICRISSHLPCVFALQLPDPLLVAQGPNGLIDKGRDPDKDADDALCTNPEQPEPQGAENGYRQERLEIG